MHIPMLNHYNSFGMETDFIHVCISKIMKSFTPRPLVLQGLIVQLILQCRWLKLISTLLVSLELIKMYPRISNLFHPDFLSVFQGTGN